MPIRLSAALKYAIFSNMRLFLIICAPAWYLLVVSFYREPSRGWRGVIIPWLCGVLTGMVALLVTLGFLTRVSFGMELPNLYLWAWIRGPGWPMLLGVLIVILMFLFIKHTSHSCIRELSGWFSGIATIFLIRQSLILSPGFEIYNNFFIPFVWLSMMSITLVIVDIGLSKGSWIKYMLLFVGMLIPSGFTFFSVIYFNGNLLTAWTLVVLFTLCGQGLVYLKARGRFI